MPYTDRLIAHRGWQSRFPENTLPALAAAIEAGARHVEFDIQLGAERQPLLCHDGNLRRLCDADVDICQVDRARQAQLSAHEPERLGQRFLGTRLPPLQEAAALFVPHPDITVYAELKRHSLRAFGIEAMLDATLPLLQPLAAHCVLISFDAAVLLRARERGWGRTGLVLSSWPQARDVACTALQPELLFCADALAQPHAPQTLDYPLAVYEIGTIEQARDWWARGAAKVETFNIGELLAATRECAHER